MKIGNYITQRITGGVAVYWQQVTNPAHALRIFATTGEARQWITGKTIDHNVAAWNKQMDKLATYETATCPGCGGPANPRLVELWGHCVKCHNAQAGH